MVVRVGVWAGAHTDVGWVAGTNAVCTICNSNTVRSISRWGGAAPLRASPPATWGKGCTALHQRHQHRRKHGGSELGRVLAWWAAHLEVCVGQ